MRQLGSMYGFFLGAAGLLAVLLCPAGAWADDDAARLEYDRTQLVERARQRPVEAVAAGEKEVRETITAQRDLLARIAPEALEIVEECLGRPEGGHGVVYEAAGLFDWVVGKGDAGAQLDFVDPADAANRVPYESMPEEDPRRLAWDIGVRVDANGFIVGPQLNKLTWLLGPKGTAALVPIAFTGPHELKLRTCRAWVDAREKQVAPRVRTFQEEQPSAGLVNDVTVSRKKARAEAYAATLTGLESRKADMIAALDGLVPRERELKDAFGILGFKLDDARGRAKELEDKGEPLPAELQETLARLRLEEFAFQQQSRLLAITVRRADERLALYTQAIRQVKEELQAASAAYQRFDAEFSRVTRMRQLDRLASAYRTLDQRHERVHAQATAKDTPEADRPLLVSYDAALEALLVVNEATTEAVQLRRAVERLMKPEAPNGGAPKQPATAGTGTPEKPAGEAPTEPPGTSPVETSPDPLRRFRRPSAGSFDVKYARDAMTMLDDPGWDAALAARQYAVVDARVKDLERALKKLRGVASLEARFELARKQAEKALDEVLGLGTASSRAADWRFKIKRHRVEDLEPNVAAFQETLKRIKQGGDVARSELQVFRAYRRRLLRLDDRSFHIRVQSDLDVESLAAAGDDLVAKARDAGRWLTFQGDEHLGSFLVRHWLKLLLCAGLLLGGVVVVRVGRKALDRIARSMASRVPQLRAQPVTVRAEDAEAKRSKAVLEAAARQAEEAALREVSKEEAAKAQRMGEGGYAE